MLGKFIALERVNAAEMHEMQWVARCFPNTVATPAGRPMRQVPVGEVVAGMTKDGRIRDEGRRQIHPSLVREEVAGDVDPALTNQPIAPPVKKSRCRRGSRE